MFYLSHAHAVGNGSWDIFRRASMMLGARRRKHPCDDAFSFQCFIIDVFIPKIYFLTFVVMQRWFPLALSWSPLPKSHTTISPCYSWHPSSLHLPPSFLPNLLSVFLFIFLSFIFLLCLLSEPSSLSFSVTRSALLCWLWATQKPVFPRIKKHLFFSFLFFSVLFCSPQFDASFPQKCVWMRPLAKELTFQVSNKLWGCCRHAYQ